MRIRLTLDINWKRRDRREEGSYVTLSSSGDEGEAVSTIGFGADIEDMRKKREE